MLQFSNRGHIGDQLAAYINIQKYFLQPKWYLDISLNLIYNHFDYK